MRVLVACEESQRVTQELRLLGHEAYSCDLLPCSGGHPEWHLRQDVLEVIATGGGVLQDGAVLQPGTWDMMIAHPPCTYLSISGAQWYYHPEDKHLPKEQRRPNPFYPDRAQHREEAVKFFIALCEAPIEHIAVENPIGIMSSRYRTYDQAVQPWMFGDSAQKTTCLWLKNLPPLTPTDIVDDGGYVTFPSGKRMPKWYCDAKKSNPAQTQYLRSKTFPGFAQAMATQWTQAIQKGA
jgi:hypothetical protein